jgi:hypothetical protein
MAQTPTKPLDPVKRARQIRDAIAKRKIKPTSITDDILMLLDQIVEQEVKQTA